MPKFNLEEQLLDRDDTPIKEGDFLTLRSTCVAVLFAKMVGDEKLSPIEVGKMGELGFRMQRLPIIDLTPEQVTMLRDRISKAVPTVPAVRAMRLLAGKTQQLTDEEIGAGG